MEFDTDLKIYFDKYSDFLEKIDTIFARMENDYPEEVRCRQGCTECCYAMFDLSLVEALYLNHKFSSLNSDLKNQILIEADKADRRIHKIKKDLYREKQKGTPEQEILAMASRQKVRCPLLMDDACVLYEHRPVTCRLYGIPMQMETGTASCSVSGFKPGEKYPTVHMHKIHDQLVSMSREIAQSINSSYDGLHTMLVPVSMCLLTEYTPEYLGVKNREQQNLEPQEKPTKEWVLGPSEE